MHGGMLRWKRPCVFIRFDAYSLLFDFIVHTRRQLLKMLVL
jgi:hypothetical protein